MISDGFKKWVKKTEGKKEIPFAPATKEDYVYASSYFSSTRYNYGYYSPSSTISSYSTWTDSYRR